MSGGNHLKDLEQHIIDTAIIYTSADSVSVQKDILNTTCKKLLT